MPALALAFSLGILCALNPNPAFLAGSPALLALFRKRSVLLLFFAAGLACGHFGIPEAPESLEALTDRPVLIAGTAENYKLRQDKTFIILTERISGGGKQMRFSPPVKIFVYGDSSEISCGSSIEFTAWLRPIRDGKNPSVSDFETYMNLKNCFYSAKPTGAIRILQPPGANFRNRIMAFRENTLKKIALRHSRDRAALIGGVLMGDRRLFREEIKENFLATGTTHLTAASGMNIALLTGPVFFLCARLRLPRCFTAAVAAAVIWGYVILADSGAAVIRAGIMASAAAAAFLLGRKTSVINLLALAVLIMLAIRPAMLADIGFQLSCTAVAAIGLYTKLRPRKPGFIREIIEISLLIDVFSLPLLLWHFNRLTPWSALCNACIIPPASLLLYGAAAETLLMQIWTPLSRPAGCVNDVLCSAVLFLTSTLARMPGAAFPAPSPPVFFVVLYYAVLSLAIRFPPKKLRPLPLLLIPPALLSLCCFAAFPQKDTVKILLADIRNGDCSWVKIENRRHFLIDCGNAWDTGDSGKSVICPMLLKGGAGKLDGIFLTHRHRDHMGGLATVTSTIKTERLIESAAYRKSAPLSAATLFAAAGTSVKTENGAGFYILWPPETLDSGKDENAGSLVILLRFQGLSALFCGDIGMEEERKILNKWPALKADVLKVAHHGSSDSCSEAFVRQVSPKIAVISCSGKQAYGHPAPETQRRLEKYCTAVYRTDRHGAVELTGKRGKWSVKTMRTP